MKPRVPHAHGNSKATNTQLEENKWLSKFV
jgi:hypothetical protein